MVVYTCYILLLLLVAGIEPFLVENGGYRTMMKKDYIPTKVAACSNNHRATEYTIKGRSTLLGTDWLGCLSILSQVFSLCWQKQNSRRVEAVCETYSWRFALFPSKHLSNGVVLASFGGIWRNSLRCWWPRSCNFHRQQGSPGRHSQCHVEGLVEVLPASRHGPTAILLHVERPSSLCFTEATEATSHLCIMLSVLARCLVQILSTTSKSSTTTAVSCRVTPGWKAWSRHRVNVNPWGEGPRKLF